MSVRKGRERMRAARRSTGERRRRRGWWCWRRWVVRERRAEEVCTVRGRVVGRLRAVRRQRVSGMREKRRRL